MKYVVILDEELNLLCLHGRTVSTVPVRPPPIIEGSQHNFRIFTINKFPLYATPDSMRILTALAAPSPFS